MNTQQFERLRQGITVQRAEMFDLTVWRWVCRHCEIASDSYYDQSSAEVGVFDHLVDDHLGNGDCEVTFRDDDPGLGVADGDRLVEGDPGDDVASS